jgi:hypothetical protein
MGSWALVYLFDFFYHYFCDVFLCVFVTIVTWLTLITRKCKLTKWKRIRDGRFLVNLQKEIPQSQRIKTILQQYHPEHIISTISLYWVLKIHPTSYILTCKRPKSKKPRKRFSALFSKKGISRNMEHFTVCVCTGNICCLRESYWTG